MGSLRPAGGDVQQALSPWLDPEPGLRGRRDALSLECQTQALSIQGRWRAQHLDGWHAAADPEWIASSKSPRPMASAGVAKCMPAAMQQA